MGETMDECGARVATGRRMGWLAERLEKRWANRVRWAVGLRAGRTGRRKTASPAIGMPQALRAARARFAVAVQPPTHSLMSLERNRPEPEGAPVGADRCRLRWESPRRTAALTSIHVRMCSPCTEQIHRHHVTRRDAATRCLRCTRRRSDWIVAAVEATCDAVRSHRLVGHALACSSLPPLSTLLPSNPLLIALSLRRPAARRIRPPAHPRLLCAGAATVTGDGGGVAYSRPHSRTDADCCACAQQWGVRALFGLESAEGGGGWALGLRSCWPQRAATATAPCVRTQQSADAAIALQWQAECSDGAERETTLDGSNGMTARCGCALRFQAERCGPTALSDRVAERQVSELAARLKFKHSFRSIPLSLPVAAAQIATLPQPLHCGQLPVALSLL